MIKKVGTNWGHIAFMFIVVCWVLNISFTDMPQWTKLKTSTLLNATEAKFESTTNQHPCFITRVVDGDTFDAEVIIWTTQTTPKWQGVKVGIRIRALHIDAPEMNTPEGLASKKFAERILLNKEGLLFVPSGKSDSFGRVLGDLVGDFGTYSEYILENKQAVPFIK